jgi:hypothetical protein
MPFQITHSITFYLPTVHQYAPADSPDAFLSFFNTHSNFFVDSTDDLRFFFHSEAILAVFADVTQIQPIQPPAWRTYNDLLADSNTHPLVLQLFTLAPELIYLEQSTDQEDDPTLLVPPAITLYGPPLLLRQLHERFGYFYFFTDTPTDDGAAKYLVSLPEQSHIIYILKLPLQDLDNNTLDTHDPLFRDAHAIMYTEHNIRKWCIKHFTHIHSHS